MSSYQGGRGAQGRGYQGGRGGQGRGGGPHHGGSQYDNTASPNWRRPHDDHHQHPGRGRGGGPYLGQNPRAQYLEPRGRPGNYMGPTPRGPSHQEVYAPPPQRVRAPHAEYPAPAQQQQAHGPYYGTVPDLRQGNQPRQPAVIPEATPEATGGGVVQQPANADQLEEQMSELAIQPATPSSLKFPRKPGRGTRGERILVRANHFLVQLPKKELQLHHYDVKITPIVTSRGINRSVMRALVSMYQQTHLNGRLPVYDGRSNLYTVGPLPFASQGFTVTLPDENRQRDGRDFKVEISLVSCPNMRDLEMFLAGMQPNAPLDTIQALDIVLRECLSNSNAIVQVGRSFFSDDFGRYNLDGGLDIWRGIYQSLRPTQMGLSLNLNTTATSFIEPVLVTQFASRLIGKDLQTSILTAADIAKIKRNLKGVKVEVTHLGQIRRKYRISGLTAQATRDLTFSFGKEGIRKKVVDYFRESHGVHIKHLNIPCLDVGNNPKKPTYLPMEVCMIIRGQKYRKKLNEGQTTGMLRATCQNPGERQSSIINARRDNRYNEDTYAIEFGLTVSDQTTDVQARVLPPPRLKYHDTGAEKECMPTSGAWNMRNKKLVNGAKLNFWYCISFSPQVGANDAGWFCKRLGDMCRTSGMEFARDPILPPVVAHGNRLEQVLKGRYEEAVNALSRLDKLPELLIVILPNNNGSLYSDLKRICETDIGLVTQCCLTRHVTKAAPQYLDNLALKINVKAGGRNTVLVDAIARQVPVVSRVPTIIFGADVTHPSPGEDTSPSIAAVVASQDWPEIAIYTGNVKAQNHRQEIISCLGEMVKEHLNSFRRKTGLAPQQIIFYRDGVSEGQFAQVLHYEINAIKDVCKQLNENYKPAITFIVVQKRHHTRLFPMDHRNTDRSGNVLPGTVVDTQICHPTEFDFYLCSHAGIKGTSRPTHYHVLWDDNKFSVDELQTLTYNLCYTYARCTRSVSIVPPAYYAHQIAFRARSYLDYGELDSVSFVAGSSSAGSRDEASSSTIKQLPALKDNVKKVMFFC